MNHRYHKILRRSLMMLCQACTAANLISCLFLGHFAFNLLFSK
uniref:Uncharacterized protein n=1 Tax=Anguilla anguilla TaxID=7936 RepID=A0A0E9PDZ1_ANGAN